jgi:hypothetical protein
MLQQGGLARLPWSRDQHGRELLHGLSQGNGELALYVHF